MFALCSVVFAATLTGVCAPSIILDDSSFSDSYPSPVPWSADNGSTAAIENAFNTARAGDSTVSTTLKLPAQKIWDEMNRQEKALYLLNQERYDRGIKPFTGYTADVSKTAQDYAQLLYDSNSFNHTEDGTPWERLNRVKAIAANQDFFAYAENLAVYASSATYTPEPVARAVYSWIYDDAGSSWGHRKFCLANNLKDNSGRQGDEGLIGVGVVRGRGYSKLGRRGYYTTIIVLNAFDPGNNWDHAQTATIPLCPTPATGSDILPNR